MTAVLEPPSVLPLVEVPNYPPSDPAFADCEFAEAPPYGWEPLGETGDFVFTASGPGAISLPSAGAYTVSLSGSYTITQLPPRTPWLRPRLGDARELTPAILLSAAALIEKVGLYKGDLWPGAHRGDDRPAVAYEDGMPLCA